MAKTRYDSFLRLNEPKRQRQALDEIKINLIVLPKPFTTISGKYFNFKDLKKEGVEYIQYKINETLERAIAMGFNKFCLEFEYRYSTRYVYFIDYQKNENLLHWKRKINILIDSVIEDILYKNVFNVYGEKR